jgi:hypothetical protein
MAGHDELDDAVDLGRMASRSSASGLGGLVVGSQLPPYRPPVLRKAKQSRLAVGQGVKRLANDNGLGA